MRKEIIIFFSSMFLLFFATLVSATQVGVYVQQENEDPHTTCLDVTAGDTAYEVLSGVDEFEFETIEDSHILCQSGNDHNFICDNANENSLRVILLENNDWGDNSVPSLDAGDECYNYQTFDPMENFQFYSFVTYQFLNIHYCAKNRDVLGVFTETIPTGQPPPPNAEFTPSFSDICEPLSIKNMKSYINDGQATNLDEEDDVINDVPKGALLELKFTLDNNGIKNLEDDIQDIQIIGTLENIDNGDDIEYEIGSFDLSPQDKEDIILKFNIPENAKEGSYDLFVNIEGEDDYGYVYELESKYEINIGEAIPGLKLEVLGDSNKVFCKGAQNSLPLRIVNTGSFDETAVIKIYIDSLGISSTDSVIVPKSSTAYSGIADKDILLNIPETANGQVDLLTVLQYGNGQTEEKVISIDISDCQSGVITNNAEKTEILSGTNQVANSEAGSKAIPLADQKLTGTAWSNTQIINFAIIAIVILAVITLILVTIILMKKNMKKHK